MNWSGKLFKVNEPSMAPPGGAMGKRVLVDPFAAQDMLRLAPGAWIATRHLGHPGHEKFGTIEHADIIDDWFCLSGSMSHLPDSLVCECDMYRFGMSFDACQCAVVLDTSTNIFRLTKVGVFHGAAVQFGCSFRSDFTWD